MVLFLLKDKELLFVQTIRRGGVVMAQNCYSVHPSPIQCLTWLSEWGNDLRWVSLTVLSHYHASPPSQQLILERNQIGVIANGPSRHEP